MFGEIQSAAPPKDNFVSLSHHKRDHHVSVSAVSHVAEKQPARHRL